ncbi:helix-turn-helix domain-containing protein [Halohasta litorea]|uniref:Helix-turn-helix domain-containing protein n=1 Tax=Halohasta litorea TaxID=869891 RepID=A0ABD6DEN8_9EURY|nr:helix-turn-helix domain-containing protein [Halohasta litorea]
MPRVRLKVGPMPDMAAIANEFPNTVIRFLSNYPSDDGVTSVLEIQTENPDRFVEETADWFSGASTVLHQDDETVVVMLEGQPPNGYFVSEDIEYHPTAPVVARDGYLFIEFVMPESKLATLWESLDQRNVDYQILSITDGYDVLDSLTGRQREILAVAVERGYYDSPRGCSLTDIAEGFDVNKSAVSGVLHRAEGEIIKNAIGDPRDSTENR